MRDILAETLAIQVEEWRCELNRIYALRDNASDDADETLTGAYQREINRRIKAIKGIEDAIRRLKASTQDL
jgi:hypothetical protein